MIRRLILTAALCALVLSPAAHVHAHIKLTKPASWIQENATGDPQKSGPCGATSGQATETDDVTTYTEGDEITVEWTETVNHEGHFRIALAKDRSELKDPKITGQCESAEIMDPPQLPVLADGLFPTTMDDSKRMYSQKVKLPDGFTCDKCTLQVMQFMTPHPAPCLYYHCANVTIMPKGAAAGSGGGNALVAPPPKAGAGGASGAKAPSGGNGAGAGGNGSAGKAAAGSGSHAGASGAPTTDTTAASDDGGCQIASGARGDANGIFASLFVLGAVILRRKRSATRDCAASDPA